MEIEYSKIDEIINDIHKSIYDLINHYGGLETDLRVSMPKYFESLLWLYYNNMILNPLKQNEKEPSFIFGIKVIPNYQNNIVIFHENGTLHKEPFYKIINL